MGAIMRIAKDRLLSRLIGLITIAAAGCQSATTMSLPLAPNPAEPVGTACQKADAMWNDKILVSRYQVLPPLTSPGILDLFTLTSGSFSLKALAAQGDELEAGRSKLIHAFGSEARLRLVIDADVPDRYSGIFRSGSQCVIGRFSLAAKPASDSMIPGLALKIFIDGNHPSVNLHLMHSVDGQIGHDFFAQTFSNILPPAKGLSKRLLSSGFKRSAQQFGAKDPNPGRLTLEHLAAAQTNGRRVFPTKAPYQVYFRPTAQTQALIHGRNTEGDFRLNLAGLQVGQAIYDIYARDDDETADSSRHLGQLVLAAPIVSSRYGDETLYFQHNMARN